MKKNYFSLMELLVTIAIIAILAALFVVGFSKSKEKASSTQCISNLRNLQTALATYGSDNNSKFPEFMNDEHWFAGVKGTSGLTATARPLNQYIGAKIRDDQELKQLTCPSILGAAKYEQQGNSYAFNESWGTNIILPPVSSTSSNSLKYIYNVKSPSRMIGFGDTEFKGFSKGGYGKSASQMKALQNHTFAPDYFWNIGVIGGSAKTLEMTVGADYSSQYTMTGDES